MLPKPTTNDRTDGAAPPSMEYHLDCLDCQFETTFEGDAFEVYDLIEEHQEAYTDDVLEHFVEFESTEWRARDGAAD